jgi:hemerythrin
LQKFRWSKTYVIYVPEFDEEHKGVFEAADALARAVTVPTATPEIQALVELLLARMAGHFAHEERMMRGSSYPSFEWHRRQHDTARARVGALEADLRRGDRKAVRALLPFLAEWTDAHIRIADRMMAAYLQNYRWARAVGWAS